MALIDILVPTYRGLPPEANNALIAMMQETNCSCRDGNGGPAHPPWKCTKGKHAARLMPQIYSSSVVHWARNQAVAQALYGAPKNGFPSSDYLFFMDDDMMGKKEHLLRLISYKADIVCGICTIRRDPPRPNIRFWRPEIASFIAPVEWDWDSQKLIEIDAAGAAFMLVKRKVLERMGQAYLDCEFELEEDRRKTKAGDSELVDYWGKKAELRRERFKKAVEEGHWSAADCWWFTFPNNVVDNQVGELGEDIGFCWKAKHLGFKIYADPQVLPGHLGTYAYSIEDYKDFVEQSKAEGNIPPLRDNRVCLSEA